MFEFEVWNVLISICASQNESARAVKYSSTVQPKCVNMKCIHTYIPTNIYSHIQTQTQITHAQTFSHAFIHMGMDARMHKHTHTNITLHPLIHTCKVRSKAKVQPRKGHESPEGCRGIPVLFI